MKLQARSYYLEAKWFHQKYIPTMDEYIALSSLTSGYPLLITTTFVTMEEITTRDPFDWLATYPKSVKGSAVVARLTDDLVSHKVPAYTIIPHNFLLYMITAPISIFIITYLCLFICSLSKREDMLHQLWSAT